MSERQSAIPLPYRSFGRPASSDPTPADAPVEVSTRAERIVQIVSARPGVTSREIIAELRAGGDPCPSDVAVHNALKRLADGSGRLWKDDARHFWPREHTTVGDSR